MKVDLDLTDFIRRCGATDTVELASALVMAQANRLGLPLADFRVGTNIYRSDQGIDGRTNFPVGSDTLLPQGACVWQIKSGKSISAADEFKSANIALRDAIEAGEDYVMFWTKDDTETDLAPIVAEFEAAVTSIRSDAKVHFLTSNAIARQLYENLGVLQAVRPSLGGVVTLETWGLSIDTPPVAFKTDDCRDAVAMAIRRHVDGGATDAVLNIVGEPGVGKSRAVFEALRDETYRGRVLVSVDSGTSVSELLYHLANYPRSHLVLVIDNLQKDARKTLTALAEQSGGRVKLITIGDLSRYGLELVGPYKEVEPVSRETTKAIAQQFPLSDSDAELVTNFTVGYPGLTFLVARNFDSEGKRRPIGELIRGHLGLNEILESLVPDEEARRLLGILSFFDKIGLDDDVGVETKLVCGAFHVDEAAFRDVVGKATGGLVAGRGRYRSITPPVVAAWLIQEFVARNEDTIVEALSALPRALQEEVSTQFSHLVRDAGVAGVVTKLLDREPFASGTLADIDSGAARFLRVAAAVVPAKTLGIIERVLRGADDVQILAFGEGRRELVWALEVLAWDGPNFDRVADLLLILAVNENETWTNNATGVLQGLFGVHLGGTTAPYAARLAWATSAQGKGSSKADEILVRALGLAFSFFESRGAIDAGWSIGQSDWIPSSSAEDIEVRMAAWSLLSQWTKASEAIAELAAPVMAAALTQFARVGLVERALDGIADVDWSANARREFIESFTTLVRMDAVDGDTKTRLESMLETWRGTDFWSRLETIAPISRWRLADQRVAAGNSFPVPVVIKELAHELASRPADLADAASRTRDGDAETVGLLFELAFRELGDPSLLDRLSDLDPLAVPAVLGAFVGCLDHLTQEEVDALLESWLSEAHEGLVIQATRLLEATEARADLCVRAVTAGAPSSQLATLYFGSWCAPLSQGVLTPILELLLNGGTELEVDHGLGIIGSWIEGNPGATIENGTKQAGRQLLEAACTSGSRDPMLELHFARVVGHLDLSPEEQLNLVFGMLREFGMHPGSEIFDEFDRLVVLDPKLVLVSLLQTISSSDPDVRFRNRLLQNHRLVSRVAARAGGALLLEEVQARVAPEYIGTLADHISFKDSLPSDWLIELFEIAPDDEFGARAISNFIYPIGGWVGPQSNMYRTSRARAIEWRDAASAGSKLGVWLTGVIEMLDRQIADTEAGEAERGW